VTWDLVGPEERFDWLVDRVLALAGIDALNAKDVAEFRIFSSL
jgi:hypothetical protein